jgi:peptide/nickel transport system substrate-binding protein
MGKKKIFGFIATALVLPLATATLAGAQVRGGVLKFAVPSVKPTLDPAHTSTGDGYMLTAGIFSNLTRADHKLQVKPQLARSWEANADASVWTFHLVKGAKFHNGREVVADDVVFTIERILDPKTASKGAKAMGPIKKVIAKDKYTVVFELKGPYADLPLQLANTFARIVAKENIKEISHKPIGSGPFRLKKYVPASLAVLERNPDYFEEGLPYLDEVHQVYIKEYAAQLSALGTGEIHMMYFVPVELIPVLEKDPNIQVLETPAPSFQPIVMYLHKKPWADGRVRQAMRLAADRESMMDAATGGHGSLGNDHYASPASPYCNTALPQRTYDPERAKQLLAEAGFKDGLDITFYTSSGRPGMEEAAIAFRESAKKAGIRVRVESVEIARLYSEKLRQPTDFMVVNINWFGRPTVDETFSPYISTGSHWNFTKYSDPKVDKLVAQARQTVDFKERKRLYDQIQRILWEEGPEVIPYFRNYISAIRKEVKNYHLIPVQWVDLREVWLER